MDAPCDQLQSKKVSHCAWSICRDVDQVLRNQKSFRCSCYGALQARGQFIESAQSPIYVFFGRFTHRALARKICQDLLDMSFWWSKRLHFGQITLFREFSCFGCGRDIWPMIDILLWLGNFPVGFHHLGPWVVEYSLEARSLCDSFFVLQGLRIGHGWDTVMWGIMLIWGFGLQCSIGVDFPVFFLIS